MVVRYSRAFDPPHLILVVRHLLHPFFQLLDQPGQATASLRLNTFRPVSNFAHVSFSPHQRRCKRFRPWGSGS